MRLVECNDDGDFSLTKDLHSDAIPPYAILSHTWAEDDDDEVSFRDFTNGTGQLKPGYEKIRFCALQARSDGLRHFWIDTCCIDKSNSTELSEAINSMFRWYKNANICYALLSDVSAGNSTEDDDSSSRRWKPAFRQSRWFTRGWTLQELLAPKLVTFFSKEGQMLGGKISLEYTLQEITGISTKALRGIPLHDFTVEERMSWAANRLTKREEDAAYSLLGIFNITMPPIYGEGKPRALIRLRREINDSLVNDSSRLLSTLRQPQEITFNARNDPQERYKKCLEALKFDQIESRHAAIKTAHIKTCKWLSSKSEYQDWLDDGQLKDHNGFLWIKGNPGSGKSTLMKYAFTTATKQAKRAPLDTVVISFFFNARGEAIEQSTQGMYRSLLVQLLEKLPQIQVVFDSVRLTAVDSNELLTWDSETLKSLLRYAVERLGNRKLICFVDALDEGAEDQVREMVAFFEELSHLAMTRQIHWRVCFSSRHYPYISISKGKEFVLEKQQDHDQDITNYIQSELKGGKELDRIREEVFEKSSGIFLWVVLVIPMLNKAYAHGHMPTLRKRLKEIPQGLHDLFESILTRDTDNISEFTLCIQWILFARRPLKREELYFAILAGTEPDAMKARDPEEDSEEAMDRFILSSSKGLAELTRATKSKGQSVQFIHESVKDFLLKERGFQKIFSGFQDNLYGQSHERLKHCCLNYVGIEIPLVTNPEEDLPKAFSSGAARLRDEVSSALPFLDYAVRHVLYHADAAQAAGVSQTQFLDNFRLSNWMMLDNLFEKHQIRRHTMNVSLLYILAEHNMASLIEIHPSVLSYFDVEAERYGAPLLAALATESNLAVEAFLRAEKQCHPTKNALVDLYNEYCQRRTKASSLGRDFLFSRQKTVWQSLALLRDEVLLSFLSMAKGDQIISQQGGKSLLHLAVLGGQNRVVKVLIHLDIFDINSRDHLGRPLLSLAATTGNAGIAKILVRTEGIDIEAKDPMGLTPLILAASRGNYSVVMQLLKAPGIDVNPRDAHGHTVLSYAAAAGNEAVCEQVLQTRGVDVNPKDKKGRSPLMWAASEGHNGVVKMLLRAPGIDIDPRDYYGQTALSFAAALLREANVTELLQTGSVDVNSKDDRGRTPLMWAAYGRSANVVAALLKAPGIDVNARDHYGRTALLVALGDRLIPLPEDLDQDPEPVIRSLLLADMIDLNSRDSKGRTPLSLAIENGYHAVAKILLEVGAIRD